MVTLPFVMRHRRVEIRSDGVTFCPTRDAQIGHKATSLTAICNVNTFQGFLGRTATSASSDTLSVSRVQHWVLMRLQSGVLSL